MENLEKLINEKFNGVNIKLDGLTSRLDTINGKVQKQEKRLIDITVENAKNLQKQEDKFQEVDENHEKIRNLQIANSTHTINCPIAPKIRKLEDEALTNKSTKKFMAMMFAGGISIGGLVVAIIKIFI